MRLKSAVVSAALALSLFAAAGLAQPAAEPATPVPTPVVAEMTLSDHLQALSPDEQLYHQHLVTLTNPFFEGRGPGTRGNALAAEYLEFYFKKYGLEPAFPKAESGGGLTVVAHRALFRQPFPVGREPKIAGQSVAIKVGNASTELKPDTDFTLRGTSGAGSLTAPVVFVGYAIQNGRDGYATFSDTDDLSGKVALVFRFEPLNDQGKSKWSEGAFSQAASLNAKLRAIAQRKAAAIVIVSPPGVDDPRATTLDTPIRTARGASQDIPVLHLSVAAAERIAQAAGTTLMDLRRAADESGGIRDLAGPTLAIDAQITRERIMADNVGAVLPGKGPLAEQYVVVGAHMDHLGYGFSNSRGGASVAGQLHPGADDNASGTAGLLMTVKSLTEKYAALPADASARSILFMGFNGEEDGLIGSSFYTKNSHLPADKMYVMLNMDMIGRLRNNRLDVSGVGSAQGFADWLKPVWDSSDITVRTLPGGSGPSDHASFYRAGIPVLAFFTGLHQQYHMPSDLYPTINTPGAVKIANLVSDVAMRLATRTEPLEFTQTRGPSIDRDVDRERMEGREPTDESTDPHAPPAISAAPKSDPANPHAGGTPGSDPAAGSGMGGVRVRFGIAPGNYGGEDGIEVGEVFPNTPAAKAGLKQGDMILKWNSADTLTVEDWMPLLRNAKPGDVVKLTVKRGSETLTLDAKLTARGSGTE